MAKTGLNPLASLAKYIASRMAGKVRFPKGRIGKQIGVEGTEYEIV
jgi:hypothetical protein